MHRSLRLGLLLALALCALPARHAEATEAVTPVQIGSRHKLYSPLLEEEREFFIYLPSSYERSLIRYPVLYLLDGPTHFHHATGIVQFLADAGRIPEMIVVGIANTDRTRDLTPPLRAEDKPGRESLAALNYPTAGGADRFLSFLLEELAPHLEAQYRTQPYRVLVGHSFGGTFALHALLNRPDGFHGYIAISPALWWDNGALVHSAAASLKQLPEQGRSLYLSMGDEGPRLLKPYQQLVRVLERKAPARLSWRSSYLKDNDHGSTPHRTIYEGLEALFANWRPPPTLMRESDLAGTEAHYAGLTKRYGFAIHPPERVFSGLGHGLLRRGRVPTAIAAFQRSAELYPGSATVYDSLGQALEAAGRYPEALESYQQALLRGIELKDPNVTVFRRHLDALRGKLHAKE